MYIVTNKYVNEYLHVNFKRFHKLSDEISFKNLIQGLQTVIKNHKKTTLSEVKNEQVDLPDQVNCLLFLCLS